MKPLTVGVITCALAACADQAAERTPGAESVPEYNVVETEDVSFGSVRRLNVRVVLPQHYSRGAVVQIAETVVADITRSQSVNAISILFYGPNTYTAGAYDIAMAEWAPNGRWRDADSVRAGDYDTFDYSVSYNAPAPAPASSLTASGTTGLLGVPLPARATLVEEQPGGAGTDPTEKYSISASAAEISGFFDKAMPAAGWAKGGNSTKTFLFYRKGGLTIGVIINRDGSFLLMGS